MRRLRPALGCLVRIEAAGSDAGELDRAIEAAYAMIEDIEQALSFHRADSELLRLQRTAVDAAQPVGTHLWNLLRAADRFWRLSGGVFDPAIAAALVHDGLLPAPAAAAVPAAGARFAAVEFLPGRRVRLQEPLWMDFGGIAKGYAVDCALAVLGRAGASSACVNAGGDLAGFAATQQIGLRDPRRPGAIAHRLPITETACASSGAYFTPAALRGRGGVRTRRRHGSVSIIASDCMTADALTKIAWAAPRRLPELLEQCGAQLVDIDGRGRLACSGRPMTPVAAAAEHPARGSHAC